MHSDVMMSKERKVVPVNHGVGTGHDFSYLRDDFLPVTTTLVPGPATAPSAHGSMQA